MANFMYRSYKFLKEEDKKARIVELASQMFCEKHDSYFDKNSKCAYCEMEKLAR